MFILSMAICISPTIVMMAGLEFPPVLNRLREKVALIHLCLKNQSSFYYPG